MTGARRWLLLATDYPPAGGGISRLLDCVVESSCAEIEWRVLTTTPGDRTASVVRCSGMAALAVEAARQSRWLAGAQDRRVVCGHVYLTPLALVTAGMAKAPCTVLAYGNEVIPRRFLHRLPLAALRAAGSIVAISEFTASRVERLGVAPRRIKVAHPGLRAPRKCLPLPRRRESDQPLRLVALTRLADAYKNVELLLRVARVLSATGAVEVLTIIGDGPLRAAMERKSVDLGVESFVRFPGRLDDEAVGRVLTEAHLGLFPSRFSPAEGGFEGFGLVIQEFAAAGLPVLAGDAGGVPDACHPSWSILLDPSDVRAWVTTITRLAGDEDERFSLVEGAHRWACDVDGIGVRELVKAIAQ